MKQLRPYAKLARLGGGRRVWAIGAVHGEAQRLTRLHDLISERFADGDRVVYLGDYLGYGDAIIATIDELLDFRCRVLAGRRGFACDVAFLRGAQEEMWQKLLQLQFAANPREVLEWMAQGGVAASIHAYGGDLRQGLAAARDGPRTITRWTGSLRAAVNARPGHINLFSALRHAALTEEGGLLFVHAAVDPHRSLGTQGDNFWWGRRDILDLDTPFEGFRRVIRGADPGRRRLGLVEAPFAVSLDGGAGFGGRLVGACFDASGRVVDHVEA